MRLQILPFCAALALFAACDNIDENDRYIDVEPVTIGHSVLVEEFSGQLCVNCPEASEYLESLQENYGADTVIVVSIHAGESKNLAIGKEQGEAMGYEGLATDFGEQLFSNYGLSSEPNAVIDRITDVIPKEQWLTEIVNALARETTVSLSLSTSYDESARELTVNVLGSSTQDFSGNVNVWLTEDSIVGLQRLSSGYVYDHVFNNIFRYSATPIEGEAVAIAYDAGEQVIYTATMTLEETWRPEKMSVVAFVDNSSGVAQTTRASVLPSVEGGAE